MSKPGTVKENATKADVLRAIGEGRLRVDTEAGTASWRRPEPKAVWRACKLEPVRGPHQRLPYWRMTFTSQGITYRCLIHRAVWWTAGREIPDGLTLNHKDADKRNNSLGNLEVATHKEQQKHANELKLRVPSTHARSLTPEQVTTVRAMLAEGQPGFAVATAVGTTHNIVSRIRRGHTYRGV